MVFVVCRSPGVTLRGKTLEDSSDIPEVIDGSNSSDDDINTVTEE